jgi:hypothetical protein
MEDLSDVVDRPLYGPDPPRGVRRIDLHWLGSLGCLALRIRGHLQGLGPDGVLAIGPRSGVQDLDASWFLGPEGTSDFLGPDWGSGLKVGSEIWDPEAS